ncbi:MAG TPA: MarR family transcriptional regulator [Acidimicrobiales bacterium]|jgi:DNA-binding MarR family transcriptional regulator|nr:MarR family transcriptional regulator [Acidimicrobiales bacterium]
MAGLNDADYQRLLEFRDGLRRFLRWSEEQAAAVGLTPAHHQLLLAVRGHPGPHAPTVSDVAGHLMLRRHSVVGLVNRAEAAGLLSRKADRSDQRVVRLSLTRLGARRLELLSALHLEELHRLAPRMRQPWAGLDGGSPTD